MVKKNTSKEVDLRKRMYELAEKNPNWLKKDFVKHFRQELVPRSTIYNILQRMENKLPPERKTHRAFSRTKMTKEDIDELITEIDHQDGISQQRLADQYGVDQSTISRTIKHKTDIKYFKKKKVPKRTEQQKQAIRPKCYKLAQVFRKKQVIIDDESYFRLSNHELSGNSGFFYFKQRRNYLK